MLNLYTDVRGNFGNISYVTEYLVKTIKINLNIKL